MPRNYLPAAKYTSPGIINGRKVVAQHYDDDSYSVRENDKVIRYFPDGKTQTYVKGSSREFDTETFILSREGRPDGLLRQYYLDGEISFEKLPNGTIRTWYENGQLESEKFPDGTEREYYTDGRLKRAKFPDNTLLEWEYYSNSFGSGKTLKSEKINKVIVRSWHENGQLAYAKSPHGKEIRCNKFGKITYHAVKGNEDTKEYTSRRSVAIRQALQEEFVRTATSAQIADRQYIMSEKLRKRIKAENEDRRPIILKEKQKTEEENKQESNEENKQETFSDTLQQ